MAVSRPTGSANSRTADPRLLVISSIGCGPPYMGNRMRMRAILEECRNLGLVIHFAGIDLSAAERAATLPWVDQWVADFTPGRRTRIRRLRDAILRRMPFGRRNHGIGGADSVDRWMAPHWVDEARRLQRSGSYCRVLVPYVFHSAFLQAFGTRCRRILDTHDKFSGRRERLAAAGITDYWFTTTDAEERRALERADVVLAIQAAEATAFNALTDGHIAVREVGHLIKCPAVARPEPSEPTQRIGVLASENPLNIDAVSVLLKEIWPVVSARHPSAQLLIAGRVCDAISTVPEKVVLIGHVEDVAGFYARCLCTVNAIRVGTGLKIKTLESLAHGCPVVASPTGADGLEGCVGNGLIVASDAAAIAEGIETLLADPVAAHSAGASARQIVDELNLRWRRALIDALALE
jgi:hypothetical protein